MEKKSQEELEKPAKVYQVDALHGEITAVRKLLEDQNTYIKNTATIEYVESRVKSLKEELAGEIKLIAQKYDPILGNAKWVARTAILAFVSVGAGILVAAWKSR